MDRGEKVELFINGQRVGKIEVESSNGGWSFGQFEPEEGFAEFAPIFGTWSLLINEDPDRRLARAAASELRKAEAEMDRLDCRIYLPRTDHWIRLMQLNIDGRSADWKAI
jgi:hypothetical protein